MRPPALHYLSFHLIISSPTTLPLKAACYLRRSAPRWMPPTGWNDVVLFMLLCYTTLKRQNDKLKGRWYAMLAVIFQYLFSPVIFLLTFILPVVFYFINRRNIWFSILLTVIVELIINWENLCYYESRGLVIFLTFVQVVVMAIIILILKVVGAKRKRWILAYWETRNKAK